MQGMLTHRCRHKAELKLSPEACQVQRRKARRLPAGTTQYALLKCRGCEGPLPLEEPVAVEVVGPGDPATLAELADMAAFQKRWV